MTIQHFETYEHCNNVKVMIHFAGNFYSFLQDMEFDILLRLEKKYSRYGEVFIILEDYFYFVHVIVLTVL